MVDHRRLPGHDVVPQIDTFTFEGQQDRTLLWPHENGWSSASPPQSATVAPEPGAPISVVRHSLAEVLELPGRASDYHFAIQGCAQELWRRRREEPDVLPHIEELCRLNLRLLEARPEAV